MRVSHVLKTATRASKKTKAIRGLITSPENIAASQASNYTYKTKSTRNDQTQKTTLTSQYDDFYDINEELQIPLMTPEEEKKIHCILELARKGKINQQNAFEIPVKVLNPQLIQNTSLMFWKFASELLHVSIHVYDKRVEYVFQNTHKIVQEKSEKQLGDEELQSKSRKKRNQLIFMNIEDIGKISKISRYEIGVVHCEDSDKLNRKKTYFEYSHDPLFKKRLQEFDSNTLKRLLLNQLQFGDNLEISLFLRNKVQKIEDKIEIKEQHNTFRNIPKFIQDELNKLNFIIQNHSVFQCIENCKRQNFGQSAYPNQFRDFVRLYKGIKESHLDQTFNNFQSQEEIQNFLPSNQAKENSFSFKYVSIDEPHCYSQNFNNSDHQVNSSQIPFSQKPFEQFLMEEEIPTMQSKTVMNPWQLEFKGLKLQKRQNRSMVIRQPKQKVPRIANQSEINWIELTQLDRSEVFQIKKCNPQGNAIYIDKNLLPKSMDIFIDIHNLRRKKYNKNIGTVSIPSKNAHQENKIFFQLQNVNNENKSQHNLDNHFDQETIIQNQLDADTIFDDDMSTASISNQTTYYKTFGLRNIRQIKEFVYQRVITNRSLKISDLNIPLSPAGIMIIFLHLVNERGLQILPIENETNILISIREN